MELIVPEWPAPENVRAAVSTRRGGCSQESYAGLNLAMHVGDDPVAVQANRESFAGHLGLPEQSIAWLQQVHGTKCIDAHSVDGVPEADASYALKPGAVCAVLTADCLPVLLCDRQGRAVAAVHAGWRGLASGILLKALNYFPDSSQLLVWLGPAIGPDRFEVGAEVLDQFEAVNREYRTAFRAAGQVQATDKYLADIYHIARLQLELGGIGSNQIFGGNFCTFEDSGRFYSFRRDGAASGRMASAIWLQP